jgi:cation transport regulator ChaB
MHQREIIDLFCRELDLPTDVWQQFQAIERAMLDVLRGRMNWHELDDLFAQARREARDQATAMVRKKYPTDGDGERNSAQWEAIAAELNSVYRILLPQSFVVKFNQWREAQDRKRTSQRLIGAIVFPNPKPQV